jgi:AcrR family transcriptional regulator
VSADADSGAVVRRAPFADNPSVGARGQRTQQRILDAALRAFGEVGYHPCNIDTITKIAGCSRISFYQYFSGKEDVFRQLAGRVARELNASTDRLDPITPDADGWNSLREWAGRFAEIHDRYTPVFHAFAAAAETDASLASDSVRTAHRYLAGIRSHVVSTTLSARELTPTSELLREALTQTLDDIATLRGAAPAAYDVDVTLDAYADVVHRSLFGLRPNVNVHHRRRRRPPKLALGPVMRAALDERAVDDDASNGAPARAALLEAARQAFVERGFHGTKVDDIVDAAGLSHGAFYRYFKNKDEIAHLVAAQAIRDVSVTFAGIPALGDDTADGRAALRRWLRAYNRAQVSHTAMIRIWVDAALQGDDLRADSASIVDWARRRMAHVLRPRGFGDPETDAIVLLAVVDTFGLRPRRGHEVEAAARTIERGFMGR